MVDGRLTTAGASSSRDADPLPEPGEGGGEEEDEAARAFGRSPGANSDDCGDPEVPDFDEDCDFEVSELQ